MAKEPKEVYHTIEIEEGFRAQPANLYEALTDDKLVSAYTQSPARIDRKEGGQFSLFDGSITGTFTSLTPPSTIVQTFRFKEWRDDDLSTVTIRLTAPDRQTCRLSLTQTHVPEHDRYGNRDVASKVEEGWRKFFFLRIQQMMGYSKQPV
jgi:activator of HSP90 ATPase